jgi:hypothetical protein
MGAKVFLIDVAERRDRGGHVHVAPAYELDYRQPRRFDATAPDRLSAR